MSVAFDLEKQWAYKDLNERMEEEGAIQAGYCCFVHMMDYFGRFGCDPILSPNNKLCAARGAQMRHEAFLVLQRENSLRRQTEEEASANERARVRRQREGVRNRNTHRRERMRQTNTTYSGRPTDTQARCGASLLEAVARHQQTRKRIRTRR